MRSEQMLYFSIIYMVFGIILCFLYRFFNKKSNKVQFVDLLVIVALVVVSSLRCNVGSDYYAYYLRYNGILSVYQNFSQIFSTSNSILFDIICFWTMKLTHYRYAIFWVISCLIYPGLILYLRKTNQKPYLGLFVFFFSGFFLIANNIIRQALAMVFVFIAYHFIVKKKPFKFIVAIFLATLFHKTAIIAGILLVISRKVQPSIKNLIIVNVVGFLGLLLFNPIIGIIDQFIPIKYLNYIIYDYGNMIKQTLSVVGYVLFYNTITIILINNKDKIKKDSLDKYKMISLFIVALPISIISIRCWPINRIAVYLYIFIIVLLPILYNNKDIIGKLKFLLTILISIWCAFIVIFGGDNEYYHYDTYLNPHTTPDYPRNVINRR